MKSLRIAIIADVYTTLPPKTYGGIERVVHLVSEALHARGHDVTIFGPEEAQTSCRLIPFGHVLGEKYFTSRKHIFRLWKELHRHAGEFDVVHNFHRAMYLLPILPRRVLKIISYACPLNAGVIRRADFLGGRSVQYTVCAKHMLEWVPARADRSKWHVVYNPINLGPYSLRETPDVANPYLAFLSRLTREKGAHNAIEVAKKAGMRLVIAGNVQDADRPYFEECIKPHVDGKNVEYVGPVDDEQKAKLLGGARAMLFPVGWDEPFGLVVGEAMACGTPVLAFRRGAMPELIEEGRTGFLCDNVDDMAAAVGQIDELDRQACRDSVETRFAPDVIAAAYERLYRELLGRSK